MARQYWLSLSDTDQTNRDKLIAVLKNVVSALEAQGQPVDTSIQPNSLEAKLAEGLQAIGCEIEPDEQPVFPGEMLVSAQVECGQVWQNTPDSWGVYNLSLLMSMGPCAIHTEEVPRAWCESQFREVSQ